MGVSDPWNSHPCTDEHVTFVAVCVGNQPELLIAASRAKATNNLWNMQQVSPVWRVCRGWLQTGYCRKRTWILACSSQTESNLLIIKSKEIQQQSHCYARNICISIKSPPIWWIRKWDLSLSTHFFTSTFKVSRGSSPSDCLFQQKANML